MLRSKKCDSRFVIRPRFFAKQSAGSEHPYARPHTSQVVSSVRGRPRHEDHDSFRPGAPWRLEEVWKHFSISARFQAFTYLRSEPPRPVQGARTPPLGASPADEHPHAGVRPRSRAVHRRRHREREGCKHESRERAEILDRERWHARRRGLPRRDRRRYVSSWNSRSTRAQNPANARSRRSIDLHPSATAPPLGGRPRRAE